MSCLTKFCQEKEDNKEVYESQLGMLVEAGIARSAERLLTFEPVLVEEQGLLMYDRSQKCLQGSAVELELVKQASCHLLFYFSTSQSHRMEEKLAKLGLPDTLLRLIEFKPESFLHPLLFQLVVATLSNLVTHFKTRSRLLKAGLLEHVETAMQLYADEETL